MIVMAMASYAVPNIRKVKIVCQKKEMLAFWVMVISMVCIAATLTGAGIVQVYLQRVLGNSYMETQSYMTLFYAIRLFFGVAFTAGLALYLYDFFTPSKQRT